MKSPFTGGETELVRETKELEFRREAFEIVHHSRRCVDTGEYFTTDELDRINITQVHNRYREKHNIPFPDQIRAVREKYGLSAAKMSEILGFGVNTYRNYESGEVPQASNGKLIKLAANPKEFRRLVEISDVFTEKELKKILEKVDLLIEQEKDSDEQLIKKLLSYENQSPNVYTGYREMKMQKLLFMIIHFAETVKPFKTRLNKLLFYSDFLNYKKTGFSISGCNYKAIELGPVPNGYDTLFEYFNRNQMIHIHYEIFPDRENDGEQFLPNPDRSFDSELFDEIELQCLQFVTDYFKEMKTEELIEMSHKEKAWENREGEKELIEYDYAFELSVG